MSLPPVIAFTPVPLRVRADGWTPELQLHFILALSRGLTPGDAARSVGKNRQNAYALRKRRGAQSFAAAWDAVVAHVRRTRIEPPPSPRQVGRAAPPAPRPPLPQGAEAEAIAIRGAEAMRRAPTHAAGLPGAHRYARRALRAEERQERQRRQGERLSYGKPDLMKLPCRPCRFRLSPALKPAPC